MTNEIKVLDALSSAFHFQAVDAEDAATKLLLSHIALAFARAGLQLTKDRLKDVQEDAKT
jgi:hypothetical protein